MALFSQDEDEETPQSNAPDFSGGPVDPYSENETPGPVEPSSQQDTPEVAPVDDAAIYSQSAAQPEEEHHDLSGIEVGSEDGAHGYTMSSQPIDGEDDTYKPIAPPAAVSLSPFADHSGDYAAVQAQKAKEALQNVKPSIGRRILAGLAGGAVTFGGGNGGAVVEKVLNRPAERAQQQWARDEAPLQERLTADQAQDQATQRANNQAIQAGNLADRDFRNQGNAQKTNAYARYMATKSAIENNKSVGFIPDDPTTPNAGGTRLTADGRTQKGIRPTVADMEAWAKTDDGKLAAQKMTITQRGILADQIGLKGEAKQRYIVDPTNVFPKERQSINIREGGNSGNHPKPLSQAQKDVILQAKQRDMTAAQNEMAAGTLSPKDGATQMQSIQDTFEQKLGVDPDSPEHMTVNPDFTWSKGGQKVASPTASAQSQQTQQRPAQQQQAFQYKGQTFTPGQTVMVNGKPAVVKGINPQTGKLIVGAQ